MKRREALGGRGAVQPFRPVHFLFYAHGHDGACPSRVFLEGSALSEPGSMGWKMEEARSSWWVRGGLAVPSGSFSFHARGHDGACPSRVFFSTSEFDFGSLSGTIFIYPEERIYQ
jgi:hypothetical protein